MLAGKISEIVIYVQYTFLMNVSPASGCNPNVEKGGSCHDLQPVPGSGANATLHDVDWSPALGGTVIHFFLNSSAGSLVSPHRLKSPRRMVNANETMIGLNTSARSNSHESMDS